MGKRLDKPPSQQGGNECVLILAGTFLFLSLCWQIFFPAAFFTKWGLMGMEIELR